MSLVTSLMFLLLLTLGALLGLCSILGLRGNVLLSSVAATRLLLFLLLACLVETADAVITHSRNELR